MYVLITVLHLSPLNDHHLITGGSELGNSETHKVPSTIRYCSEIGNCKGVLGWEQERRSEAGR